MQRPVSGSHTSSDLSRDMEAARVPLAATSHTDDDVRVPFQVR
jgi:hypothetical protein